MSVSAKAQRKSRLSAFASTFLSPTQIDIVARLVVFSSTRIRREPPSSHSQASLSLRVLLLSQPLVVLAALVPELVHHGDSWDAHHLGQRWAYAARVRSPSALGKIPWTKCTESIVLIPGLGTAPVENWPFCSALWLHRILPPQLSSARILTFDFHVPLSDSFSWQYILLEGSVLLKALSDYTKLVASDEVSRQRTALNPAKDLL